MTGPSRLAEPLSRLLGTRTAAALEGLGIATVEDLLRHYPRRYGAPGQLTDLAGLQVGEHVTVMARVETATVRTMRQRSGAMLEARVTDGSRVLSLTFFAKRAGALRRHEDRLRPGRTGLFTGTVGEYRGSRQLTHPDYLVIGLDAEDEEQAVVEAGRPIPLYPASAKVPTWRISRAVRAVLDPLTEADVPDPVPAPLLRRHGHGSLWSAWRDVHAPDDEEAVERGRARLAYEEAFVLQAALARRRAEARQTSSVARPGKAGGLLDALDARLPFPLTEGQRRVGGEIAEDLARPVPMQRLLQGEVGAGKTVVALRAMAQVVDSGGQAVLLAPTEVLAAQHARSLEQLLGELAHAGILDAAGVATRVAVVTGSQGSRERRQALAEAASGAAGIIVGTHALLGEGVQFADLGLVVVDEQHRFGVEQREALRARSADRPHLLVMTATPIPRTIAMTVFGDLETSTLRERPAGRAEVATHVVPAGNDAWLARVWARVREEVDQGRRAYVVCPRIEGDAAEQGSDEVEDVGPPRSLASVVEVAEALRGRPELSGVGIGVMHGRLAPEQKDAAMAAFASGERPVLVSTTVIEVGVDVPAASAMVVLDADRFGLSQLHQLRGRIGRSEVPGVCLLVSAAPPDSVAEERLRALAATGDGFALAETDLRLRREGDVLGVAQSGGRNSLRVLRVLRDREVIESAREDADALLAEDPGLASHPVLVQAIADWLGDEGERRLRQG